MKKIGRNVELIKTVELVIELIVLTTIFYLLYIKTYSESSFTPYLGKGKYTLQTVYAITMFIIIKMNDGFKFGNLKLSHTIIAQCSSITICNIITFFYIILMANQTISLLPMLFITVLQYLTCFFFCYIYTAIHHLIFAPKDIILFVEKNSKYIDKYISKVNTIKSNYSITEIVYVDKTSSKILEKISKHDAVMLGELPEKIRKKIIKLCYENNIKTYIIPSISDIIVKYTKVITISDAPYFVIKDYDLTYQQNLIKRIMDIILSTFALICSSLIMIAIAIAIKSEDGGPIIFKQKRVTKDYKIFEIYKFRTMTVKENDPQADTITKEFDEARITKVGNALRRFRLDELPQIFNILIGDMSIVGPRPEMIEDVEKHCKELLEFKYRYKVKAGLTGYAQVYGKHNTSSYDKIRMDLLYIENYSILMDIKIIIDTIRVFFDKESNE